MKLLVLLMFLFHGSISMAAGNYRLITETDSFSIETFKSGAPDDVIKSYQSKVSNLKRESLTKIMNKLKDQCLNPQWPNPNALDVVSVTTEPSLSGDYATFGTAVTAICNK